MKEHLDAARQRREAAEAAATPEERLATYAVQTTRGRTEREAAREEEKKDRGEVEGRTGQTGPQRAELV